MMPRSKAVTPDEIRTLRRQLQLDVEAGGLTVRVAVRRMRQALAMTQGAFAKTFGLTIRQVWELEAGVANPTAATLERLAKPFGFTVGFVTAPRPARAVLSAVAPFCAK
jgi:DNA-binding XRE family transcriptional regulator